MKSYEIRSGKHVSQSDPALDATQEKEMNESGNKDAIAEQPTAVSEALPQEEGTKPSEDGEVIAEQPTAVSKALSLEEVPPSENEKIVAEQPTVPVEILTEKEEKEESEEADDVADLQPSPVVEQEIVEDVERTSWFVPPTKAQIIASIPFWAVIIFGAILRFWGLGDKPLHHDESLHAYFSLQLLHNNIENWAGCFNTPANCYHYDPLLHGPFQFHAIALVYKISQLLGVYDNGVNTFTVRIAAATLGTIIVGLPYFLRDYLGKIGAWLACFLLAVSPSMVYFSRFAREDIYMACFTLLLIVSVARYVHDRKMRWLVLAAVGFAFSYATKEATFLSIAIFGAFFGGLLAWELGLRWQLRSNLSDESSRSRFIPKTGAPIAVLLYLLIAAPIAKVFFGWLKELATYISDPKNTTVADNYVQGLKDNTVAIVPWIGIFLGLYVLSILAREMLGVQPGVIRRNLMRWIDPKRQPLLDTLFTMPWTHWFFALLAGWTVFLVLFTVLFTYIRGGIGDGIWQGLYYWLKQQQVARGGQPWYYYLLLIPLYEQIGLVFGLVGVIRSLMRPTRFRLFLVFWFVGNVGIYSWAAEKMPWLMIHMTMPMLLLAAIGLEPFAVTLVDFVKGRFLVASRQEPRLTEGQWTPQALPQSGFLKVGTATLTLVLAFLLLLPTLQNMYQVTYVHPADGPHEMMVYVQTTTDVNAVMAKVDALDQKLYGGKHLLSIGVMEDAVWPFAWYLRDYTKVCFNFPSSCADANNIAVIITGGDKFYTAQAQYGVATDKNPAYTYHKYHLRTWWDEGYKMPPCVPGKTNTCAGEPSWGGVGPFLWLSYGSNPPPHAQFDLGRSVSNVWNWWWQRKAIGSTDGAYDMGLFIRKDLGVTP